MITRFVVNDNSVATDVVRTATTHYALLVVATGATTTTGVVLRTPPTTTTTVHEAATANKVRTASIDEASYYVLPATASGRLASVAATVVRIRKHRPFRAASESTSDNVVVVLQVTVEACSLCLVVDR